jgi:hypothetical protein
MASKKPCSGKIYTIKRKKWCVGEKKSSKNANKRKRTNKISKKIKKKSIKSRKKGGAEEDKVNCCMCGQEVNINDTLMPSGCKMKNGMRAHRICQECWWNPETGFGKETSKHKCPGCEKGLPLTTVKKEEPIFIDLTEHDNA